MVSEPAPDKPKRVAFFLLSLLAFFALPLGIAAYTERSPVVAWLSACAAMGLVFKSIGELTELPILTDERRRWSLSRLQLLAWTGLLLPTLWTMVVIKLLSGVADVLGVGMNETLWALLGISATSALAAPILLERKRATLDRRSAAPAPDPAAQGAQGAQERPGRLGDLFRGEEVDNAITVDVARTQLFLFTAIALVIYLLLCWRALASQPAAALGFPPLSEDLVTIIAISHATYLAGKLPRQP